MKPGDTMIRVSRSGGVGRVTVTRVGRKWVTTDYAPDDRYHVGTLEHERRWATLRTPEAWEAEQAERAVRMKLERLLQTELREWRPMDRVRRLIAALEE